MVQGNLLLFAYLALFLASACVRTALVALHVRHIRRHEREVPPPFAGRLDEATIQRMADYTIASSRVGAAASLCDDAVALLIVLGGFLPWLLDRVASPNVPFALSGLLFFGVLGSIGGAAALPFSAYRTFGIEKRFGFSTITVRMWIADLLKQLFLTAFLAGCLLSSLLLLIQAAPDWWWLWVWFVFSAFQLLLLWLYPVVIAPLFHHYEPVKDEQLKTEILALMGKAGLRAEGVYQVDAGKRSRHTNAYFTGLGKTKRIVLFDTLLQSHTSPEILAILAHEIGHWQRKHLLKKLVFLEAASLLAFFLLDRLLGWPLLYETFGFARPVPYAGIFLLSVLFGPVSFFLSPLAAKVSRRSERQADRDSAGLLGTAAPMIQALKRLAKDNLANLHPHPLYAWFHFSHPPLTERIAQLEALTNAPAGGNAPCIAAAGKRERAFRHRLPGDTRCVEKRPCLAHGGKHQE